MAIRNTVHILKNSDIVNRPLPSSLQAGEPIVNTANGIMYFSGVTTSTDEWTPAGTGTTANFFEVGSNLYDLRLRNKLTQYEGISGAGLVGKFLSGTTDGFVLADISDIQGVDTNDFTTGATLIGSTAYFDRTDSLSAYTLDLSTFVSTADTYVTAFTYNSANEFTISRNQGFSDLSVTLDVVTGLTVNGTLSATTLDGNDVLSGGTNLSDIFSTTDLYTTGGTLINSTIYFDRNDALSAYTVDLSALDVNDTFVTGFTYDNANLFTITRNDGTSLDATINTVTGMTNTGNLDLQGELANSTGNLVINDNLDITGTTTSWGNILPDADITRDLGSVGQRWSSIYAADVVATGLTIAGLGSGRVVYTDGSGGLTTEAGFEYNAGTDTLLAGNVNTASAGSAFVGTGGLIVGSGGSPSTPGDGDVVIHGNLTVFGTAITASTGELYIEDNQITLNYNPTGDTSASSIGSGFLIQDGDGSGNDVNFDIRSMNGFTGLTASQVPDITEYTGPNGFENRAFVSQINDIVLRSNSVTTPNGVRVLAEFDVLDGGTY